MHIICMMHKRHLHLERTTLVLNQAATLYMCRTVHICIRGRAESRAGFPGGPDIRRKRESHLIENWQQGAAPSSDDQVVGHMSTAVELIHNREGPAAVTGIGFKCGSPQCLKQRIALCTLYKVLQCQQSRWAPLTAQVMLQAGSAMACT